MPTTTYGTPTTIRILPMTIRSSKPFTIPALSVSNFLPAMHLRDLQQQEAAALLIIQPMVLGTVRAMVGTSTPKPTGPDNRFSFLHRVLETISTARLASLTATASIGRLDRTTKVAGGA